MCANSPLVFLTSLAVDFILQVRVCITCIEAQTEIEVITSCCGISFLTLNVFTPNSIFFNFLTDVSYYNSNIIIGLVGNFAFEATDSVGVNDLTFLATIVIVTGITPFVEDIGRLQNVVEGSVGLTEDDLTVLRTVKTGIDMTRVDITSFATRVFGSYLPFGLGDSRPSIVQSYFTGPTQTSRTNQLSWFVVSIAIVVSLYTAVYVEIGTVFVIDHSCVSCGRKQSRDSNSQNCLFHSFQCLL